MLFNSIQFALFLPIVLILYWALRGRRQGQNVLLLAASYVFYCAWDWRFLSLLMLTSATTFASGLLIERAKTERGRKGWMLANVLFNILILCYFKYFNFFSHTFAAMMLAVGWHVDAITLDIVLPLGISFYTFQAVGYSVDVYRRKVQASHNAVDFFAFIAFFPQLVSGPIERAQDFLPQLQRNRQFDYADFVMGLRRILWGLVKKVIIADGLAEIVERSFDDYHVFHGSTLLLAVFFYGIQMYCDFSGYSDIAVGVGRLFGIRLTPNFHFSLFSRSINELWQRWNITLMRWLRDYVYIPLGGSRKGLWRKILNIWIVFLVSGLWHGADMKYILWAMGHAVFMMPMVILGRKVSKNIITWREIPLAVLTFFLHCMLLVFYKMSEVSLVWRVYRSIFKEDFFAVPDGKWLLLLLVVPLILIEWFTRHNAFPLEKMPRQRWLRFAIYWAFIFLLLTVQYETRPYIYFRF